MDRQWTTREYQPGDEFGIVELWNAVFPQGEVGRGSLRYWHWQYRDCPAGQGRIRLAVKEDRIVGHYAVVPMFLQYRGEILLATLALDTMTHPDYRHQGVFVTLARDLYADLARDRIGITYAFPNENSFHGAVNGLEFTHICSPPMYVRPLRLTSIVEEFLGHRLVASVAKPSSALVGTTAFPGSAVAERHWQHLHWLSQFDDRISSLWRFTSREERFSVFRSSSYLDWRYFRNPVRDYHALVFEEDGEFVAVAFLRCIEQYSLNFGIISELMARPNREDALEAVLLASLTFFSDRGMDLAACLCFGDDRVAALLKRKRFLLAPERFSFKEWRFCVRRNSDSISADILHDSDNWYLTLGDNDVF